MPDTLTDSDKLSLLWAVANSPYLWIELKDEIIYLYGRGGNVRFENTDSGWLEFKEWWESEGKR